MIRIMKESCSVYLLRHEKNFRRASTTIKILGKKCGINLFYRIRFKRTPPKGKSRGGGGRGVKASLGRVVPPRPSI